MNIGNILIIAEKIAFRFLTCLIVFLIIITGVFVCWQAFIMNQHWDAIKSMLALMATIIFIALCQQVILWLLPKKERNFWHHKFI